MSRNNPGRMNLIALLESLHTFKNGKPCKSWTHQHSGFEPGVMNIQIAESEVQTSENLPDQRRKSIVRGAGEPNQDLLNPSGIVET